MELLEKKKNYLSMGYEEIQTIKNLKNNNNDFDSENEVFFSENNLTENDFVNKKNSQQYQHENKFINDYGKTFQIDKNQSNEDGNINNAETNLHRQQFNIYRNNKENRYRRLNLNFNSKKIKSEANNGEFNYIRK